MKTTIIYSEKLKQYNFGTGHPFRSDRFEKFRTLFEEVLGENEDFELVIPSVSSTDEELELWHTQEYISAVKEASNGSVPANFSGFVSADNMNPETGHFPEGIEEAARAVVKSSMLAADYIQQSKADKAVSIGGGLHHARPNYGEGFCVYNDVVIAVKHAVRKYNLEKVLVLDTDAHAGNGTCEAFYSDPRILFIDMHRSGIYPGTGFTGEIGEGKGKGFTVNLPLMTGTSDNAYEMIFDEIVYPVAEEFKPQMIVRYGGSDPHFKDPLTGLGLTLDGFKMLGKKVSEVSEELCEARSMDLICSGYDQDILAQVWLTLITSLSGVDLDFEEQTPANIKNQRIQETNELIGKVKKELKPHWKSFEE